MRQVNQTQLQKEIEEEIGEGDNRMKVERNGNNYMEESYDKRAGEVDPMESQTSDFYQVPI